MMKDLHPKGIMVSSDRADTRIRPDLMRSWGDTPSLSGTRPLRMVTGGFYAAGGVLTLVCTLSQHGTLNRPPMVAIGVLAIVVGLTVLLLGARIARFVYHGLVGFGSILITLLVIFADGGAAAVALSAFYSFVVIDAIFLFPLREALGQIMFAAITCVLGMTIAGGEIGNTVVLVGVGAALTLVIGWLAQVAEAADVDPLTRLLNRRGLDRKLEDELARTHRLDSRLSLVVLDIDNFKGVNDSGGHARGDRILVACAKAWTAALPEGATLARYGGDEFAVLLPGVSAGRAGDIADDMRALVPSGTRASSGVAAALADDTGSVLFGRADTALYEAKTSGRDRTVVHGDPTRASRDLEQAIAEGQMVLHLQPIVQLSTDTVVGHEALVRWQHPTRGLVPPMEFVPAAERTGAIHALGAWVREEAARLAMTVPALHCGMGVNISVHELRTEGFVDGVAEVLDRWGMSPDMLVAEVTESVFDDGDPRATDSLNRLRELGVVIAMDDFGSGYSSLRRIQELPIDLIKIDGSLIQRIDPESYEAPILEAVAAMARSLDLRLVAERVETAHQAAVLRHHGYDLVQGYLFGRPEPY